jgi:hypothetical protein
MVWICYFNNKFCLCWIIWKISTTFRWKESSNIPRTEIMTFTNNKSKVISNFLMGNVCSSFWCERDIQTFRLGHDNANHWWAFQTSEPIRTISGRVWSRHFFRTFRMHTQILGQAENCDVPIGALFRTVVHCLLPWLRGAYNCPEISKIDTDFTVPWLFFSVFRRLACFSTQGRRLFRW